MSRASARARDVAVLGEHALELRRLDGGEALERRRAGRTVHAQVERALEHEAHAARGIVDLPRRDAEVEQRAGERLAAVTAMDGGQIAERGPGEHHAISEAAEPLARDLDRVGIAVAPQQSRASVGGEQRLGVAGVAERGVEQQSLAAAKVAQRLREEHRLMTRTHAVDRSAKQAAPRADPRTAARARRDGTGGRAGARGRAPASRRLR